MKAFSWVLMIAVCLTSRDVQNAACRTACVRSGYTGGVAGGKSCVCTVQIEESLENFIQNRITLRDDFVGPAVKSVETTKPHPRFEFEY